jgi:hypothetical protein
MSQDSPFSKAIEALAATVHQLDVEMELTKARKQAALDATARLLQAEIEGKTQKSPEAAASDKMAKSLAKKPAAKRGKSRNSNLPILVRPPIANGMVLYHLASSTDGILRSTDVPLYYEQYIKGLQTKKRSRVTKYIQKVSVGALNRLVKDGLVEYVRPPHRGWTSEFKLTQVGIELLNTQAMQEELVAAEGEFDKQLFRLRETLTRTHA